MSSMANLFLEIEVSHAKCRILFREETEHPLTSLQIIVCLVKAKIKNQIQDNKTFFSANMWNRKENDLTYRWNSCSPRSQSYRYKYSYLLRRDKLHRFRKEEGHSRRYLKKRNKWWKICNLYSNSRVYIQNTVYVYGKK